MVCLPTYAAVILSALISSTFYGGTAAFAFAIDARPSASAASLTGRRFSSLHLECSRISIVGRGGALFAAKDDEPTSSPREEALTSMKTCYKTVFAAVAVDTCTRLMPDVRGGWKIMLASRPSSWLDVADAVSSINLVAFGLGLWWVTRLYDKNGSSISYIDTDDKEEKVVVDMSVVTNVMSTYRIMYLATGWTLVGLSMRLADKVFVSNTSAPFVVLAMAVGASVYIKTNFFTSEADIANSNNEDNPAMMNGIEAARNMSFCAVSFLFFAVLRFAFWSSVVVPSDLALPIKILQVNKFLMPLALSKLLQSLDRRFLDATMELTKISNIENQKDADVFRTLKEAEKSFYAKVAKVLKMSIILDILRYGIPIMIRLVKGIDAGGG